jgi:hypothetical protein
MLKYIFFLINIISIYLLKESKLIKWGQEKNRSIKYNDMKKNKIKIIKKNKIFIYSTSIKLTFQMVFSIRIYILFKILIY